MSYSYDRRAAKVPPSLGHRSGYELRVIGFLSDVWPFLAEDKLDAAARGVDTMKRKHPELWKGLVEVNLAPKEVADIIVSVALKESQGFKSGSSSRSAAFLVDKLSVEVDVNLYPEKLSWAGEGKVLMTGAAEFVLPNHKYKSEPYELEVLEDGTAQACRCSDPLHHHLIWLAAKARKRGLAELIVDQKDRGSLRKKS